MRDIKEAVLAELSFIRSLTENPDESLRLDTLISALSSSLVHIEVESAGKEPMNMPAMRGDELAFNNVD